MYYMYEKAIDAGSFVFVTAICVYAISIMFALAVIFLERRDSSSTLAWVLVLLTLPIVGVVFYILFSQNIVRRKLFLFNESEEELITRNVNEQAENMSAGKIDIKDPSAKEWNELITFNQRYAESYYTQGNAVEIIIDGNDLLDRMLGDIKNAKKSIDVMFFIVKNDKIGRKFIRALTEKAKEGVKVRFLVDSLGSRQIGPRVVKEFTDAGGKFETFFSPMIRHLALNFNYRNHRKIAVIDDEIAYTGGYNIAKEYADLKEKFGHWRDTHIRIKGQAVNELKVRFEADWRTTQKKTPPLDIESMYLKKQGEPGDVGIQMVSSGPHTRKEEVKHSLLKMITEADRNIYIQTPYFVPDAAIQESLIVASQSGVDVKIMIPNTPDHIFVYWATYSYVGELIRNGVEVYIYDNGFLHAKTVAADGKVCTVGSTNFDRRSFRLNFETNAFMYNAGVTEKLEQIFEEDIKSSHRLTLEMYENRSIWIKFKESISRLVSDLL